MFIGGHRSGTRGWGGARGRILPVEPTSDSAPLLHLLCRSIVSRPADARRGAALPHLGPNAHCSIVPAHADRQDGWGGEEARPEEYCTCGGASGDGLRAALCSWDWIPGGGLELSGHTFPPECAVAAKQEALSSGRKSGRAGLYGKGRLELQPLVCLARGVWEQFRDCWATLMAASRGTLMTRLVDAGRCCK